MIVSPLSAERQVKSISSHRAAEVSIRLLGERLKTGQSEHSCRAFVFLMDRPELAWITQGMHRILAQSGYNCRLSQLNETSNGGQPQQAAVERHQYWMLPTTSAAFVRNASSDHVVLLVPANLEAVLTAYQNIKRLAQRNTPEIAVILVGAPDQNSAWHYFRKLAMGAMRYLDIPLLNLGYLPDQLPSQGGSVQEQPDNYLAPIIDRLLRSEFYTEYPAQKFVQRQR